MKVALGWKGHAGWAALVAIGGSAGAPQVIERRRVELVDDDGREHARQPYHAADGLPAAAARAAIERAIAAARARALTETRAAIARARAAGHQVVACAVVAGTPMPAWSVAEILAVHVRMHQAEGALFRDVLVRAAATCELAALEVPEQQLGDLARAALAQPPAALQAQLVALGRSGARPGARIRRTRRWPRSSRSRVPAHDQRGLT